MARQNYPIFLCESLDFEYYPIFVLHLQEAILRHRCYVGRSGHSNRDSGGFHVHVICLVAELKYRTAQKSKVSGEIHTHANTKNTSEPPLNT